MNVKWFKDPDNIVYAEVSDFIPNFAKETGIADLAEKIDSFRREPSAGGATLTGKRRTSVKLFIPDLVFDEHLDMGENVWMYLGENYPCYCLYENRDE
ncbi:hypothetical protein [Bacilliculturomica massiliensis]|uniref:hypothetical protein n=1 Tax=Bacilliculturomica massiliensis TaxID=1917867 RepID=UPI0010325649|nr:hypothetical protein [Bacilliculturomica massiliensis]